MRLLLTPHMEAQCTHALEARSLMTMVLLMSTQKMWCFLTLPEGIFRM